MNEDVFPIEHVDFPASCLLVFRGVQNKPTKKGGCISNPFLSPFPFPSGNLLEVMGFLVPMPRMMVVKNPLIKPANYPLFLG